MSGPKPAEELCTVKCVPCEGGVPKLTTEEATAQIAETPEWTLLEGPDRIRREWTVTNFMEGLRFFQEIADLAEAEGHHPDLHLVGYRHVAVEIWTHAINGLSLNDFILAAKIDRLEVNEVRR